MEPKGFFGSLFDLSFSSLVTPKVIKFIYVLTLIAIGWSRCCSSLLRFAAARLQGL